MENGRFRKGFLSTVRTIIKNEIRGKKKKILKSLTGQLDPQSVAEFEWKKVVSEAGSQAPMLSTALDAAFPPEEVKSPRFVLKTSYVGLLVFKNSGVGACLVM